MLKCPGGKIIQADRGFEALLPSPEPCPAHQPSPHLLVPEYLLFLGKETTKPESGAEIGFLVLWPALVITQLSARL